MFTPSFFCKIYAVFFSWKYPKSNYRCYICIGSTPQGFEPRLREISFEVFLFYLEALRAMIKMEYMLNMC